MEKDKYHCLDCDAKFTNMDRLHVHQRRHGMSLSLTTRPSSTAGGSLTTPSISSKGSFSATIIGFPDETPTPTRFIRNCEEVGLFQDLQNVNPFDEDFKKAAGSSTAGTPSAEGGFEFTFAASAVPITPMTPNSESALCLRNTRSKRRYSDHDTLNTPQVFPCFSFSSTAGCATLTTNTASMSACLTPTPQSLSVAPEGLRTVLQNQEAALESPPIPSTTYNHEEHVSIITYTSAISQQMSRAESGNKSDCPETSHTKSPSADATVKDSTESSSSASKSGIRPKPNLKLDLKTVVSKHRASTLVEKQNNEASSGKQTSSQNSSENALASDESNSKEQLLERNRAAAHRSRERRKQWIYGLESRCRALETLLAQSQAEVCRLKVENEMLRTQLANQHTSCQSINESSNIHEETNMDHSVVVIEPAPTGIEIQRVIQEPLAEDIDVSSGLVATIVSPIVLPTVKARRGRPRKGEERRVPILSVPIVSEEIKIAPKIPILPSSHRIIKK